MRTSNISHEEKYIFEDAVTPTRTTSAANLTRLISEKLLDWGVEERGAYRIILTLTTWSTLIRERFVWFAFHSIGIRPVDIEERTETHFIKIFFVWLSANMNILSCVCLSCSTALVTPGLTIWLFRRFASGTLGPVTFGLGLRDSCLVILFFNLICAIPSAYL